MRHARPFTFLVLSAAAPVIALAQSDDDGRFRAIEAGFEDLSPHAASNLGLHMIDLRADQEFASVYEITDSPGLLARRAGAVTAVFARSVYDANWTALVPPGTVFYIGSLPVDLGGPGLLADPWMPEGTASDAPTFVDRGVNLRAGAVRVDERIDLRVIPSDEPSGTPPPAPELWTSEPYRQRRVGEIIRGFAWRIREAEAGGPDTPSRETDEARTPPASAPDRP